MHKLLIFALVFGTTIVLLASSAAGQTFPELELFQSIDGQTFSIDPSAASSPPLDKASPTPSLTPLTQQPDMTVNTTAIRSRTRILAELTSPPHSTSGTQGSGIYLEVLAPVIQGDRIVIPAHSFIQGTVQGNKRPGHFKRTSEFRFHFTAIIFPNNHVEPMDAVLQSIPGSKTTRARSSDGTLQTVDQAEKVLIPTSGAAVSGGVVGSVSRLGVGTYIGAGLGAGVGLGAVLLHRGDDIDLPLGTRVEMVLRSEIALTEAQQKFNSKYIAPPPTVFPSAPEHTRELKRGRHHGSGLFWPLLGTMLLR
ncbi:MAG TPA: hypothetical protein VFW31_16090 [Candidatus Angelobacter sp.]|nr:hypothetical protein [Candidatus Angelobacter sp.]